MEGPRKHRVWRATYVLLLATACGDDSAVGDTSSPDPAASAPGALATDGTQAIPEDEAAAHALEAELDREYPLHGLVTGMQLVVRGAADPESSPVGWLRIGARVRVRSEHVRTPTCSTGWYQLYPQGWACAGQGIEVGEEPPPSELAVPPPARDAALPYMYYYVKDDLTPEYHRLPSRDEQRAAVAVETRVTELVAANQEQRAARVRAGEAPNEPTSPAVVYRYLDRGFYVAVTGIQERASRRFARTVRNRYVKEANLEQREGSSFSGVEIDDEHPLPLVWAVRSARPMRKIERADGTIVFRDDDEAEVIERHTLVQGWQRRENIGGQYMHVLEGERYVRDWFFAIAERIDRPREVGADEPWVHVDKSQQTLVLYEGDTPRYATLVSTGLEGFDTPTGLFTIRRKYVADTMANIGDGQDNRYSIEDVPWTEYFEGSYALHGAFWHDRFGLQRSHGCVNLAPIDAHHVFDALWPHVPDGWLGVTTDQTSFRASHVLVTD